MLFKNGLVFYKGDFAPLDFTVKEGFFTDIAPEIEGNSIDLSGKYVISGLVDIHTHGAVGEDFSTASVENMRKMAKYYLSQGVTTVVPTLLAMKNYDTQIENLLQLYNEDSPFVGLNLEGPFLNPLKKGAINEENLREIDVDFINSLWIKSNKNILLMTASPEKENYDRLLDFANGKFKISLGHTDCDGKTAQKVFQNGACHVTHLFNAMPPLHHRNGGIISVALSENVTKEVICDGIHIDDHVLHMLFKGFSSEICMISDSMAATGLNNGEYVLGDLPVSVKDKKATLSDGTIAGSSKNLFEQVKYALSIGIDPKKVIKSNSVITYFLIIRIQYNSQVSL